MSFNIAFDGGDPVNAVGKLLHIVNKAYVIKRRGTAGTFIAVDGDIALLGYAGNPVQLGISFIKLTDTGFLYVEQTFDFTVFNLVLFLHRDAGFQHAPGNETAAPLKFVVVPPFGVFVLFLQVFTVGFNQLLIGNVQHVLDFSRDILDNFRGDLPGCVFRGFLFRSQGSGAAEDQNKHKRQGAFHLYHWSFIPFTGDQRPSTLYSSSGGLSVPGTVFSTEKPAQGSGVLSGDGELSGETEGSGDADRPGTGREREESEIPVVFRMCPVHSTNVNRKAQTISSVSRRKRERICFIQ